MTQGKERGDIKGGLLSRDSQGKAARKRADKVKERNGLEVDIIFSVATSVPWCLLFSQAPLR